MSDTPLRTPTLLSVVAPVYDEEELIEEFVARTCAAAADYEFELVLVNDGSTDRRPSCSTASPRPTSVSASSTFRATSDTRPP